MNVLIIILTLLTCICSALPVQAWYPRDAEERALFTKGPAPLIGKNRYYQVAEGETLIQLARAFGLGYNNRNNFV